MRMQSHIGAITLGLLLTLFGHDVLMASGPHPSVLSAQNHHAPAPDRECGPTRGAHPQLPSQINLDCQAASLSTSSILHPVTGFLPHWSIDPGHPPAIKRAFLQVYLN